MTEDKRQDPRSAVHLDASLHIEGEVQSCKLKNISKGGAQVGLDHPPVKGMPVSLQIAPFGDIQGQVAWQSSRATGIKFEDEAEAVETVLLGIASNLAT